MRAVHAVGINSVARIFPPGSYSICSLERTPGLGKFDPYQVGAKPCEQNARPWDLSVNKVNSKELKHYYDYGSGCC